MTGLRGGSPAAPDGVTGGTDIQHGALGPEGGHTGST